MLMIQISFSLAARCVWDYGYGSGLKCFLLRNASK
jgi:hypothetical protein